MRTRLPRERVGDATPAGGSLREKERRGSGAFAALRGAPRRPSPSDGRSNLSRNDFWRAAAAGGELAVDFRRYLVISSGGVIATKLCIVDSLAKLIVNVAFDIVYYDFCRILCQGRHEPG